MDIKEYFSKIVKFYRDRKRMPSYAEITALAGFKSKNAAHKLANKLAKLGWVQKDDSGRLLPSRFFDETRMLGFVEAGFPSPAEEELTDTMNLDEYLVKNKEATYVLTVKGDSMKDAGIIEGDLVLVERGTEAKDGDIVIAQIDDDWTIKYLRRTKGLAWLEPANKNYKKLYPKESLKIGAVVKAVIRKY